MPIYIGDYLADTMDLNDREHGIYFLLMLHYWKTGPLLNDKKRLIKIARTDNEEALNYILDNYFDLNGDECWHNKREDEELEKAKSRRESAVENGKKGGRPKKPTRNPQETHRLIEGIPTENPKGNPRKSSSSSPSSLKKEREDSWSLDDLIKMIDFWNDSKYSLPKYPKSKYKTGVNIPDVHDLLKNLSYFTREQISQSIINYSKILNDNSYKAFPTYPTAISFLIKGIESYYDDAKPFERCLKSGEIKKKKIDDKRQKNRPTHCKQCSIEINDKNTKISTTIMQCRECKTIYKWNGHEWIIDK